MTQKDFLLFGFACGRSEAPQFVEPVFIYDERLWVQSASADNEFVRDFVQYNEDIEILESSSIEILQVGKSRIFAVRDIGDRIVFGDRAYVSKYLAQNLKNYLDRPYFLVDAARFSNKTLSDFYFIKSDSDLIQAAALAGSLRRFCEREVVYSKKSISSRGEYDSDSVAEITRATDIMHNTEGITVFKRWLDFAETDSPRLAKHSSWGLIDDSYRAIFSKKTKNVEVHTLLYFKIAQLYIDSVVTGNEIESSIFDTRLSRSSYLKSHAVISFHDMENIASIESRKSKSLSGKKEYTRSALKRRAESLYRRILDGVERKKISDVEISMTVYFLNLILKFTLENLDKR